MKNRIAIIALGYPLGVLSDITSMAFLLQDAGFLIDIFIDQYMYKNATIDFNNKNIKIVPIETVKTKGKFWSKRIFGYSIWGIYNFFAKRFVKEWQEFARRLKKYINEEYVCIIGIEPQGLIAATIAAKNKNIPVIYHNMELLLEKECVNKHQKNLKKLEITYSQKCLFTIIQDENRAKYLIEDNNLDPQKIKLLPVCSLQEPYKKTGDYLYKKLNIPKEKIIILSSGNLSYGTMGLEIAQSAREWPDEYVLVIHTWTKFSPHDKYINEIKKIADNKKVYLSNEFIPFGQLPELLSSAKIGLLFYRNMGPNSYEIGSSSNKLVEYLRAGLPIISIDFPSLKNKIEKNNCGICVENTGLIGPAIYKIMKNYDYYSENSHKLYKKDYDFTKNFKNILEEIKKISKS